MWLASLPELGCNIFFVVDRSNFHSKGQCEATTCPTDVGEQMDVSMAEIFSGRTGHDHLDH